MGPLYPTFFQIYSSIFTNSTNCRSSSSVVFTMRKISAYKWTYIIQTLSFKDHLCFQFPIYNLENMAFILIVQYDCCSASHCICLIKLEAEVKNIGPSLRALPENCKKHFPLCGSCWKLNMDQTSCQRT